MSKNTITLHVLLFSVLREKVGTSEVEVRVAPPATAQDVLDELVRSYPAVAEYGEIARLAVNQEYVPGSAPVGAGDEVAIITPVSGG